MYPEINEQKRICIQKAKEHCESILTTMYYASEMVEGSPEGDYDYNLENAHTPLEPMERVELIESQIDEALVYIRQIRELLSGIIFPTQEQLFKEEIVKMLNEKNYTLTKAYACSKEDWNLLVTIAEKLRG